MNVALVYDRVTKWGGAERVLLALHDIWPNAPLYTAVYDKTKAPWARVFDVRPSFLQRIPFVVSHHEFFPWLTPFAFESFSFDEFDVVISVTSAEAKDIVTKPDTLHICYCLTPTRYLWGNQEAYLQYPPNGLMNKISQLSLQVLTKTLRSWDYVGGSRPDYYIAISQHVGKRIQEYYHRAVDSVIYPPLADLPLVRKGAKSGAYFLVVSRLVGYKRVDLIVDAFNRLGLPLIIVGDGRARASLIDKAKPNITFVSQYLTDRELVGYYEDCHALIVAGDEDFGLAAIEANKCGKPVIAYSRSGVAEIVIPGKTGILFDRQTPESLLTAMDAFKHMKFDTIECERNAKRFSGAMFASSMRQTVEKLYASYTTI